MFSKNFAIAMFVSLTLPIFFIANPLVRSRSGRFAAIAVPEAFSATRGSCVVVGLAASTAD